MRINIPPEARPPLPPQATRPAPAPKAAPPDPRVPQKFPSSQEGSRLPLGRPGDPPLTKEPPRISVPTEEAGARVGAGVAGEEVTEVAGAEAAAAGAAEIAIPVVGALVAIGAIAGGVAAAFIGDDNKTREAYTQNFVATAGQKFPNCNVVICHPQHRVAGPQVQHQHFEVNMKVGTCGYDAYSSPMGQPFIFENQGDGGYLNWAYAGEFSRNGNTLTAASKLPTPKL